MSWCNLVCLIVIHESVLSCFAFNYELSVFFFYYLRLWVSSIACCISVSCCLTPMESSIEGYLFPSLIPQLCFRSFPSMGLFGLRLSLVSHASLSDFLKLFLKEINAMVNPHDVCFSQHIPREVWSFCIYLINIMQHLMGKNNQYLSLFNPVDEKISIFISSDKGNLNRGSCHTPIYTHKISSIIQLHLNKITSMVPLYTFDPCV